MFYTMVEQGNIMSSTTVEQGNIMFYTMKVEHGNIMFYTKVEHGNIMFYTKGCTGEYNVLHDRLNRGIKRFTQWLNRGI